MNGKRRLRNVNEVVDFLGGTKATADLLGTQMQSVSNWRRKGNFTPDKYVKFQKILASRGISAPDKLWLQQV